MKDKTLISGLTGADSMEGSGQQAGRQGPKTAVQGEILEAGADVKGAAIEVPKSF